MTIDERINALKSKHADLEHALDEESQRPLPDFVVLTDIKRQKLRIKDEIFRLSKQ